MNGSKIKLTAVKINETSTTPFAAAGTVFTVAFPTGQYTTSTTATGATLTAGAWATVGGVNLLQ